MRILFVRDHKVQQHDGKGQEYKAGTVYTFEGFVAETYARKYIGRGLAAEALPEQAPAPQPEPALRTDGPTLAEYIAAGYSAEGYPPSGYASKEEQSQADRPAAVETPEPPPAADPPAPVEKAPEPQRGVQEAPQPRGGRKK